MSGKEKALLRRHSRKVNIFCLSFEGVYGIVFIRICFFVVQFSSLLVISISFCLDMKQRRRERERNQYRAERKLKKKKKRKNY